MEHQACAGALETVESDSVADIRECRVPTMGKESHVNTAVCDATGKNAISGKNK